jgi:hypothetical protein
MEKILTPCGLDLGNRRTKIHLFGLSASIPSVIGFDKPITLGRKGTEIKPMAFSLLFRANSSDYELWFGRDVLASQSILQEIDDSKYTKSHIQRLFQAVLWEWSRHHKQDISQLGKLNIVASIPPGQYQKPAIKRQAEKAYSKAFSTGQSHMKIRPAQGEAYQVVTQFDSLVKEASLYGQDIPRKGQLVLVVDLGGGTTDFVLFNGSSVPVDSRSVNNGLFHVYQKIDYINPQRVELRIISDKSYWPNQLISYFNGIRLMIQAITRELPKQPDRIDIIGGGANLMSGQLQSNFKQLAKSVYIKNQYVNAIANWKEAGKNWKCDLA